jgi:outer membrane protein assembly factor BamB
MNRRQLLEGTVLSVSGILSGCLSFDQESSNETVNPSLEGTSTNSISSSSVWSTSISDPNLACVSKSRVVIAQSSETGQRVVGVERKQGQQIWETPLKSEVHLESGGDVISITYADDGGQWSTELRDSKKGSQLWETPQPLGLHETTDSLLLFRNLSEQTAAVVEKKNWTTKAQFNSRLHTTVDGDVLLSRLSNDSVTLKRQDITAGEQAWQRDLNTKGDIGFLASIEGSLLFITRSEIIGLSSKTGKTRFRKTNDFFALRRTPLRGSEHVYFGRGEKNTSGVKNGGVFVFDPSNPSFTLHHIDTAMAARPIAYRDGPIVQLADEEKHWVAAFTPDLSKRRWRRVGTVVAQGPRGLYILRGNYLIAVADDGTKRWRVSHNLGKIPASLHGLSQQKHPTARYDDVVVMTGPEGLVSYDARDGTERARVTGLETKAMLPRPWRDRTSLVDGNVLIATDQSIHAISV